MNELVISAFTFDALALLLFVITMIVGFSYKLEWFSNALTTTGKYCIKQNYKVWPKLISFYKKIALLILLYGFLMIFFSILGVVFSLVIYFLDNKNKFIYKLFGLDLTFLLLFPAFISKTFIWYINQIKWEKINNKMDDEYLIEKNIDANTNQKQLNISSAKYKYKILGKFRFVNFLPKKFNTFSFEKKQFIVYMNLVLDYDKTLFAESSSNYSGDFTLLNINMFKDEAIKYEIIQKT